MKKWKYISLLISLVGLFFVFYYIPPLSADWESIKTVLTISTFIFAIFAGFFISRQGNRYTKIKEFIVIFDGNISSMYRSFGHLGAKIQNEFAKIALNHYNKILDSGRWDYHLVNKSNTMTSVHSLLDKYNFQKDNYLIRYFSLQGVVRGLERMQEARKGMVSLYVERVPAFQWVILYSISIILFVTLITINSQFVILLSIIKSFFICSIIAILILLHHLDRLDFFEGIIGENSAKDIIGIIEGKK